MCDIVNLGGLYRLDKDESGFAKIDSVVGR